MSGDNKNGFRPFFKNSLLPWFQELPRWYAFIDRHHWWSMRDIDRVHQTLLAKRIKKCCLLDSKNETSASTTRIGSLLTEHVHLYIYIYIYIYISSLVWSLVWPCSCGWCPCWRCFCWIVNFTSGLQSDVFSNMRSVVNLTTGLQSHLYTTVCSWWYGLRVIRVCGWHHDPCSR